MNLDPEIKLKRSYTNIAFQAILIILTTSCCAVLKCKCA